MPPESTRLRKITLASKLGISRPTLDKYLGMVGAPEPDENGSYDVEAVAKFIEANLATVGAPHGKREPTTPASSEEKTTLSSLKIEKLSLECQKLRHALEVDRGDYISKREAAATIVPLMAELGSLLTQTFEMELPSRYVSKDAVDCAKLNADAIDKIIKRFKAGAKVFTA